ncbi:hypothetical protein C8J55DRAFT_490812 [Lentinula edodes]|uniref:Uncharacterized protein n=1 Tax=Lentinula lateritia TaxID=40482 RepID=A0A9W9A2V4_9AGAR|nr:hypothetical protein C8J55DRAFT_490812 [Lentinula edodes]
MRFNAVVWISLAIFTIFGTIVHAAPTNLDGSYVGGTFVHESPDASKELVVVMYNAKVDQSGRAAIQKLLESMFDRRLKGAERGWTESRIKALGIKFNAVLPNQGAGRFPFQHGKITFSISGNFGNCYNRGCMGTVDNAGEGRIIFVDNKEVFYSSPHNTFTDKI